MFMINDHTPAWIAKVAIVSSDETNSDVVKLLLEKRKVSVIDVEDLVIDERCRSQTIGFLLDHGNIGPELTRMYKRKLRDLQLIGGTAITISAENACLPRNGNLSSSVSHHRRVEKPFNGEVAEQIVRIVDMRC